MAGYVRSTLRAYERTRSGRGQEAADRLREWADVHGVFAHFRMCDPTPKGVQPPLGWALSEFSKSRIESYLINKHGMDEPSCFEKNKTQLMELEQLLMATTGDSKSPGIAQREVN